MQLPDLSLIAAHLLAVTAAIYAIAVTMLRNAIETAKNKVEEETKKASDDLDLRYSDLENKLNAARKTKNQIDIADIESKIAEIKTSQNDSAKKKSQILTKYAALDFKNSIVLPSGFFLMAYIFSELAKTLNGLGIITVLIWIVGLAGLVAGIYKLARTLLVAREIAPIMDSAHYEKLTAAFESALVARESASKTSLYLLFSNVKFPFPALHDTELAIEFSVGLMRGLVANDVEVWFFVPDGFGLVSPPDAKSWRQAQTFLIPNIRTVKLALGRIREGTKSTGQLKIKTPSVPGNYTLFYTTYCDGFKSDRIPAVIHVT